MGEEAARDPDVALMLRVKNGDRSAFEQLVVRHQRAVINAAFRYTGNPSVAEDLAQDAFLRVYRSAPAYEPSARFTTWLFTIVRNICANYRARQGRHDHDMESEADWSLTSAQPDPEQSAMQEQMKQKIRKALMELPKSMRLPLILSHYNQLPYDEIAEIMDLSLAAVKVRIHRARLMLAQKLTAPVTGNGAEGLHE